MYVVVDVFPSSQGSADGLDSPGDPFSRRAGRVAETLAVGLLAATVLLALINDGIPLIRVSKEDSWFEYLTAWNYGFAGAALMYLALRRHRGRVALATLGFGMLFVGGEEISWGQRIFGIDTPADLADKNLQGELTLHNLDGIHQNIRLVGLAISLAFYVVWPWLEAHTERISSLGHRWGVPVPSLRPSAVILAISLAIQVTVRVFDFGRISFNLEESAELILSLAPALLAIELLHQWRRLDRLASTEPAVASRSE